MKVKYLILGAGPAGLSFAAKLKAGGEESFLIIEKENSAGGLCRSAEIDGYPLDIGGGHALELRRREAVDFLFSFMPQDEWNDGEKNIVIDFGEYKISYPLEANIWQLPAALQDEYIDSVKNSGSSLGLSVPERFEDWVYWKFGKRIAEDYMLPYNRKLWGKLLPELDTRWLYKLPDVSAQEIFNSIAEHKAHGKTPSIFHNAYPKKTGYGEVFLRIAKYLDGHIVYNTPVTSLCAETLCVNGEYSGEKLINTIPWQEFSSSLPEHIAQATEKLKYTGVDVDYFPDMGNSTLHAMYCPSPSVAYNRVLFRENFSLIAGCHGAYTETNHETPVPSSSFRYFNKYAYPVSTFGKDEAIASVLSWGRERSIFGLGRWGEWAHMNSDVAVLHGLSLAREMLGE